jgi:hypothetical protein
VSRSSPEGGGSGQPLLARTTDEGRATHGESLLSADSSNKLVLVRATWYGVAVVVRGWVRETSSGSYNLGHGPHDSRHEAPTTTTPPILIWITANLTRRVIYLWKVPSGSTNLPTPFCG